MSQSRSERFRRDLEYHLRAGYPAVWVACEEESRVEAALMEVRESVEQFRDLHLWTWTCTDGLVRVDGGAAERRDVPDPFRALGAVDEISRNTNAVFLVKDLHPYLQAPNVVRRLKDLCTTLKASRSRLVLTSYVAELPAELQRIVAVIRFELPDAGEIGTMLDRFYAPLVEREGLAPLDGDREAVVEAALGLTEREAEDAFALSLVRTRCEDGAARLAPEHVARQKANAINRSGVLEFHEPSESMEQVGGLGELKTWFAKRSKAFTPEAREYGLPSPRGVMLIGVAGCGKSLIAKALSNAWGKPLLRLDMGRMFGSLVGQSEAQMRRALATAEACSPCILFMDEAEKGLAGAGSSGQTDSGTTARVSGTFLSWMQDRTAPVFVVATCNSVASLPPEWLRKGRWDDLFFADLPTPKERAEILKIHVAKRGRDTVDFDFAALASKADGFSGAELEEAVVSALYDSFDAGHDLVQSAIANAISETIPLSRTMEQEIGALRKWASTRARPAGSEAIRLPDGRALTL